MLVHICCSIDSHYFLQRLRVEFPDDRLVGYFYNPNIHPKEEYDLRLQDAKRSCNQLGIELLEGPYDVNNWLGAVKGLEDRPEKGERCEVCFEQRFVNSAAKAKELGLKRFTSTLLQSPLKDKNQIDSRANLAAAHYGVSFVYVDYLSGSGKEAQGAAAKESRLYRQNYCGCLFGLLPQRARQNKLPIELFSPLRPQIQPASAASRTVFYDKLGQKPIQKNRRLLYRLLSGGLSVEGKALPSYILAYSKSSKASFSASVATKSGAAWLLSKEEAKLVELKEFNEIAKTSYATVSQMIANPPSHEVECEARQVIANAFYDLSAIFIVDEVDKKARYDIRLESALFEESVEA